MQRRHAKTTAALVLLLGASVLAAGVVVATGEVRDTVRDPEQAQERRVGTGHTLGVRVVDADGEPVAGAAVHIVLVRDGERHRITHDNTDRRGHAVFELRPGGYEVHVRSDDGDAVKGVRLHESQRLSITVSERPAHGHR